MPATSDANAAPTMRRNLAIVAFYDVVIRIGWIFKTESVIIPAFLDRVAGAGWLRGCLPVVNRFGQSVPPALFAGRLERMPRKRNALALWTFAMALAFLSLAAAWWLFGSPPPPWMAALFLINYAVFSIVYGLNQLAYGTVFGKLIGVAQRGRLMAVTVPTGSVMSIAFAVWLLGDWLERPDGGFVQIFGFTGVCFLIGAVAVLLLREHPTATHERLVRPTARPWTAAWRVLRGDANFRRFAWVTALVSTSSILFPHYQALARERFGLSVGKQMVHVMIWVVVQNAAMGLFGLLCGWLVHRWGERLAVRVTVFSSVAAPLTACGLMYFPPDLARDWFWIVFVPMGMNPLLLKALTGYTLEIAPVHDHPRYLSTTSLCQAGPFVCSPLVGWFVDAVGFEAVFAGGAALIFLAGLLTLRLVEPRHRVQPAAGSSG